MPVSTEPPADAGAVAVVPGQTARHAGGRNSTAAKAQPTVDSHTAALGIIQPPPDVRAIVDKTAQFVARNGECGDVGMVATKPVSKGLIIVVGRWD